MAENVQIVIEAVNNASADLKKIRQDVSGIEGDVGKMSTAFQSSMKSVAAWIGGFIAVDSAIGFIKDSVKAALDSEKAQQALKKQVEATGASFAEYQDRIESVIESSSQYALVQDEDVSGALKRLILTTGDVEKSLGSLNLVFDLAKSTGMNFERAATVVGKALEGNATMVQRLLPELDGLEDALGKNSTAAERAEFIIGLLNERVGGQGKVLPGYTRAVGEFSLAWEQFKEDVGTLLLPVLGALLKLLSEIGGSFGRIITGLQTVFFSAATAITALALGIATVTDKIGLTKNASEDIGKVFDSLSSKTNNLIGDLVSGYTETANQAGKSKIQIEESTKATEKDLGAKKNIYSQVLEQKKLDKEKADQDKAYGIEQEKIGKSILLMAQSEFIIREDIRIRTGKGQEELGRVIQGNAQLELRIINEIKVEHGKAQEAMGKAIRDRAKVEFDELQKILAENGRVQEAIGTQIRDNAKTAYDEQRRSQEAAYQEQLRIFPLTTNIYNSIREFGIQAFTGIKQAVGDSVANMILSGGNLRDSFKEIGKNLLGNMISFATQMAIEWGAKMLIMGIASTTFGVTHAAASGTVAAGNATMATSSAVAGPTMTAALTPVVVPLLLIAAAAALVAAAIWLIGKTVIEVATFIIENWDRIKEVVRDLFDLMVEHAAIALKVIQFQVQIAIDIIIGIFKALATAIGIILDAIKAVFKAAFDIIEGFARVLGAAMKLTFEIFREAIGIIFDAIKGIISSAFSIIEGAARALGAALEFVFKAIGGVIEVIAKAIGTAFELAFKFIHGIKEILKKNFTDVFGGIGAFVGGIAGGIGSAFSGAFSLISRGLGGLVSGLSNLSSKAGEVFSGIGNQIQGVLGGQGTIGDVADRIRGVFGGGGDDKPWEHQLTGFGQAADRMVANPSGHTVAEINDLIGKFRWVLSYPVPEDVRQDMNRRISQLDGVLREKVRPSPIYNPGRRPPQAVIPLEHGGIVTQPTFALIGEAGPEAVIPLNASGRNGARDAGITGGGQAMNITINFTGPVMGDRDQARRFAMMIDKELYELKIRNLSTVFA